MEEQIFFVKKIVLWSWKGGGGFSSSQLLHQMRRDLRIWGGEGEICRRVKKLLLAGVHLLQLLESGVWRPLFLGHKHQFYLYRFSWLPPTIGFSELISLCIFFNYFSLEATTIIINFSWYWLSVQLCIFQLIEYIQIYSKYILNVRCRAFYSGSPPLPFISYLDFASLTLHSFQLPEFWWFGAEHFFWATVAINFNFTFADLPCVECSLWAGSFQFP